MNPDFEAGSRKAFPLLEKVEKGGFIYKILPVPPFSKEGEAEGGKMFLIGGL